MVPKYLNKPRFRISTTDSNRLCCSRSFTHPYLSRLTLVKYSCTKVNHSQERNVKWMKFLSLLLSFTHSLMRLLLLHPALVDIWSPVTKLPFYVVLRLKLLGKHSVCMCVSQVHHLPPGCKRMIKLASSALASLSHLILFSLLALCRKCVWVRNPAESCCPASPPTRPRGRGEERKSRESWGEMWLQVFGFHQVCRARSCVVCMCHLMGVMCCCLNSYQEHISNMQ